MSWRHEGLLITAQPDKVAMVTRRAAQGSLQLVKSFLRLSAMGAATGGGQYSCEAVGGGFNTLASRLTFDVCKAPSE